MPYIGKNPVIGNFVKLDAITTSATATYNLTNGGVAYFPQTANNCIVSLNGVIQSPTSAYTISGSTIVFSDALTASDSIDFILVLGDVLSIGTPSDGTVSTAKIVDANVTTAKLVDGSVTAAKVAAGAVVQVVSSAKTDSFNTTSLSYTDVTGLSVSITPSSASNKILILAKVSVGTDNGTNRAAIVLDRNSTDIFKGDTAGSRTYATSSVCSANDDDIEDVNIVFLDSPNTTSSTTYKIQCAVIGSGTIFVNQSFTDTNNSSYLRTASSITVMEIKG